MDEVDIRLTQRAMEKFREIVNGSRKDVTDFFESLTKSIVKSKNFDKLFEIEGDQFYYKKCKNINIIFSIKAEGSITVVDFLTETELNELKQG